MSVAKVVRPPVGHAIRLKRLHRTTMSVLMEKRRRFLREICVHCGRDREKLNETSAVVREELRAALREWSDTMSGDARGSREEA